MMLMHLAGEGIANMCEKSRPGDRAAEEEEEEGDPGPRLAPAVPL